MPVYKLMRAAPVIVTLTLLALASLGCDDDRRYMLAAAGPAGSYYRLDQQTGEVVMIKRRGRSFCMLPSEGVIRRREEEEAKRRAEEYAKKHGKSFSGLAYTAELQELRNSDPCETLFKE